MQVIRYMLILMLLACSGCESGWVDPGDVSQGKMKPGSIVTVEGEVEEWIGPRTFSLDNTGPSLEPVLIVVSKKHLPEFVVEESIVRVTGVVHEFGVKELEKTVGFDFDPEMEAKLRKTKRFLVADKIQIIDVE